MEKKSKYKLQRILFSRKALSLWGLAALTIALTLYFRVNKFENFVEAQKGNLLSFYTKNLEPLLLGKEVTNEDIFNFAFYHELPLDRKNHQYLQFGKDTTGKEFVEFRDVSQVQNTDNLEAFSTRMNFNPYQRKQMDSILSSYGEKIKSQILVSDNNTVAINENLWNLNKALLADLFMFASKVNRARLREMVPPEFEFTDNPQLPKIVDDIKTADEDRYLFVTSDSIFMDHYKFDIKKFEQEAEQRQQHESDRQIKLRMKLEKDYAENLRRASGKHPEKDLAFSMDSTSFRIRIPEVGRALEDIPDLEEVTRQMETASKLMKNLKFMMRPPVPSGRSSGLGGRHPGKNTDSSELFELNLQLPNVDSIVHETIRLHNLDSLVKLTRGLDSLKGEKLKESMRKVRREIKRLEKEYKKNSKQETTK